MANTTTVYESATQHRNQQAGSTDTVAALTQAPTTEQPFRIRLSDLKIVYRRPKDDKKKITGKMLRFNLSWLYDSPVGLLGETLQGCLAEIREGRLVWTPPLSRTGFRYMVNSLFTEDYYLLILAKLSKTKLAAKLAEEEVDYLEYIQTAEKVAKHGLPESVEVL